MLGKAGIEDRSLIGPMCIALRMIHHLRFESGQTSSTANPRAPKRNELAANVVGC